MQGQTALHIESSEGLEDSVDLLSRQGANVNALTAQVWPHVLLLSTCSQGLNLRGLLESHYACYVLHVLVSTHCVNIVMHILSRLDSG